MGRIGSLATVLLFIAMAASAPTSAQSSMTGAKAQNYPTKYVRIITGGAGNMHDLVARQLGQRLSAQWGQSVVVDNRPGAGMTIGTGLGARATPDGYTLLISDRTAIAVAPSAFRSLSYDPVKDLAPVTLIARAPLVVVTHPSVPVTGLQELVNFAKRQPGALNYAGSGPATVSHIAGEMFKQMVGVNMMLVQYKGSPAAMAAVVTGEVGVGFVLVPVSLPHLAAGKLRAAAITSAKRFSGLPEVPTSAEAGLPGFETDLWLGMFVPTQTPNALIARLNRDVVSVLRTPEMLDFMIAQGAEISAGTPEEFAVFIKSETARMKYVIDIAGIRMN